MEQLLLSTHSDEQKQVADSIINQYLRGMSAHDIEMILECLRVKASFLLVIS